MHCSEQSQFKRCAPIFVLCALLVLFLNGCSLEGSGSGSRSIDTSNARKATLDNQAGIENLRDLAKPPSLEESSGIKASSPRGMNLELKSSLFSEKLKRPEDRFDRLEDAVQDIRNDFDDMAPAISRLVATEADIQELIAQLSVLLEEDRAPEPIVDSNSSAQATQDPVLVVTTSTTPSPAPQSNKASSPKRVALVSSHKIRAADHPNKTRIVLESPTKVTYKTSFDQNEQFVLVEMSAPVSESSLKSVQRSSKRVLEASLNAEPNGNNTIAILTKDIASMKQGVYLSPNADNANYRYYFDLTPSQ